MPPIKPSELKKVRTGPDIPEKVIEVFNEHIKKNWDGGRARVLQKDVLADIVKATGESKSHVFKNRWLDVEEAFRKAGWRVKYDQPVAWGGENFEPYYVFSPATRGRYDD